MGYALVYTDVAHEDIEKLKKSGDMVAIRKLARMLEELIDHPFTGSGKPEQLRYNFSGCWSRRISRKHRLVYTVDDKTVTVHLLSVYGHYDDR
ncbi:Txe/YoeB family addiction module toxin [Pelodictyon phaeoclathratiforme]|jgi:toxin YoeB|uniref:Putative mRNA interferase YoeB n=1 Tax=Pelodictyon phaeoclathratiforme (strain DSM 5477 / BU-1) TaxID=324925 RepID=B4SA03_PELPB|nr:Txe/YoeB family addiction module toxin [Pelodictyon phaeoclathratiforme]ACF43699.1 addiction module toxin, Txe/YoeB family [Pelodictyon phaeoclathratiforme BU-1]MBV5288755.1 Txe/YoeB family addiction module toxin [Pelodictyon phaeoclathratiforme]